MAAYVVYGRKDIFDPEKSAEYARRAVPQISDSVIQSSLASSAELVAEKESVTLSG
jgi:hypothetical protein